MERRNDVKLSGKRRQAAGHPLATAQFRKCFGCYRVQGPLLAALDMPYTLKACYEPAHLQRRLVEKISSKLVECPLHVYNDLRIESFTVLGDYRGVLQSDSPHSIAFLERLPSCNIKSMLSSLTKSFQFSILACCSFQ